MKKKYIFIFGGLLLLVALTFVFVFAKQTKSLTGLTIDIGEENVQIDKNDCITLEDFSLVCKIGTAKIRGGKTKVISDKIKG